MTNPRKRKGVAKEERERRRRSGREQTGELVVGGVRGREGDFSEILNGFFLLHPLLFLFLILFFVFYFFQK